MKMRRILATAVAAAVTTPAVFLSAAPAFADTKPAAQTQQQKPTIEQLKLAVAKAQKAYDEAEKARQQGNVWIDGVFKTLESGGTHPLAVALTEAKTQAAAAAEAKTAADAKLDAAEKALAALPESATQEEKDAAQQAVTGAKAEAATAAAAKTAADDKVKKADVAVDDARVAAAREYSVKYQKPDEDAAKALEEAKKALKEAEEAGEEGPEDCKDLAKSFTVRLTGPKQIAAGASGDFSLRVTNGTGAAIAAPDALLHLINAASGDGNLNHWLDLKASVGGAPWVDLDEDSALVHLKPMKAGATADVRLRVAVDAKAPKAFASLLATVGYDAEDGTCGWGGDADADFTITEGAAKPSKPAKPAKPATGNGKGNGNATAQGGSSTTPVTTHTGGSLASTGAGSSTMPIALAGGAAVVLGAGAMVMVRRRKAGSDA
ncbi:LPXTG cell wall anchor domain-containing protein [Streptomyces sp. NPDC048623]|uniref:LPXTG cell wall anchor domain-containing protein n=1 Tax=Streptomyces sp. NPDC048623 TaxID=3155761 RepID=UPI0034326592